MIWEKIFDINGVPKDAGYYGRCIEHYDAISLKNRHRSKVLTSKAQILEHRELVLSKKMAIYDKQVLMFAAESLEYEMNTKFEAKIDVYHKEYKNIITNEDETNLPRNNDILNFSLFFGTCSKQFLEKVL